MKTILKCILIVFTINATAQKKQLKKSELGGKNWEIPVSKGWKSLQEMEIPEWMVDAKFGVYTHWGVYSVAAHGGPDYINELYVAKDAYDKKGVKEYHRQTYGAIKDFGYIDLIDKFEAKAFDASKWAKLMKNAGAKFGGICVVHHDGFCLWDSKYTRWNSKQKGPKKDIYGEIAAAVKAEDMKLIATFHHARTFGYAYDKKHMNEYTKEQKANWDLFDPQYADFFRNDEVEPQENFGKEWIGKVREVMDNYEPDVLWFDGLSGAITKNMIPQDTLINIFKDFKAKNSDNVVCNKLPGSRIWNFPEGVGIRCYEGGRDMEPNPKGYWLIDRAISYPWSYVNNKSYRDKESFHIRTIIDLVSRGGVYLLSLTPKGDGSISEGEIAIMNGIGDWMDVNGEAIFETRKWCTYGHGTAQILKEKKAKKLWYWDYRAIQNEEVRFTRKKDNSAVYAISTGWPESGRIILPEIKAEKDFATKGIASISLLGADEPINWKITEVGLEISLPSKKPCDIAYSFKITPRGKLVNYDRE